MYASLATVCILFVCHSVLAQSPGPDSLFVQQAKSQAVRLYEQTVKQQAHVYEGDQYIGHDPRIKVHPYYLVDSLQRGTVLLSGVQYRDVHLLYDIVWDQVVIQPLGGGYRLRLQTDKIGAFSLGSHQFARIVGDSVAGVRTGFYEVIYNGKVKALAKRVKTVQEDISDGTYKGTYLIKDRFLVQKDGAFYDVKSKGALVSLFPDQAKELRRYMRKNKLRFREGGQERAIAQTVQRYEELTR